MLKKERIHLFLIMTILLAACGGEGAGTEESNLGEEMDDVKLVLNWFAKSQHGGVFAAQEQEIFAEYGLNVQIENGGPQVSAIQIVASGNAEFGLAHADQIVIARNEGIELVTLAATMQNSPQALMFHEGEAVSDFEDLNGRTAYIQPGIPYWDYLKSQYDLSGVTELGYTGQHVNFIDEKKSVSQAFVTSEPFFLNKEGVKTEAILVSESGFDPYNVVLFTTENMIAENKDLVERFVNSFVEGWEYYLESPYEINKVIHEVNPNLTLEDLQFETDTQRGFIYGEEATEHGFGFMSEVRWETLINQLFELGLLEEKFETNDIFTTDFLPLN
ncbi:ABC transporter substrate-binding protein [Halalkalibacter krulwichiae]|uniref:Thiamine pyrimidine synthase n=1 Tax=Halalkalibacter krulwichiae TaxID=199441 RepID=A0A1X9M8K7_9BACI|nr:ABC transporter substrate-binding protein [Halalkalibacter krulwichiae]ARK28940.1 NMT1/THI5 like protein [Halalkalibacter krulwichiae]